MTLLRSRDLLDVSGRDWSVTAVGLRLELRFVGDVLDTVDRRLKEAGFVYLGNRMRMFSLEHVYRGPATERTVVLIKEVGQVHDSEMTNF